jgi:hypothetical protein
VAGTEVALDQGAPVAVAAVAPRAPAQAAGLQASVLGLQRTAGNAAVARISGDRAALARCAACGPAKPRIGAPVPEDEELLHAGRGALQRAVLARTVTVQNPGTNIPNPTGSGAVQTNAATVQSYLSTLCPAGGVSVNTGTGAVTLSAGFCGTSLPAGFVGPPSPSPANTSTTPVGCGCLCDMTASAHAWTIVVDDADWPHTSFADIPGSEKAGTGTGGTVTCPSPNSPKIWGAALSSGSAGDIPPWLVLGHELCGHAWMGDHGGHAGDEAQPRGEGGHQDTVARENLIRREHGISARGGFKDPHCGESYYRDKSNPGTVNWSSFHATCLAWRAQYNRTHGTNYQPWERIP